MQYCHTYVFGLPWTHLWPDVQFGPQYTSFLGEVKGDADDSTDLEDQPGTKVPVTLGPRLEFFFMNKHNGELQRADTGTKDMLVI